MSEQAEYIKITPSPEMRAIVLHAGEIEHNPATCIGCQALQAEKNLADARRTLDFIAASRPDYDPM